MSRAPEPVVQKIEFEDEIEDEFEEALEAETAAEAPPLPVAEEEEEEILVVAEQEVFAVKEDAPVEGGGRRDRHRAPRRRQ